MLQVCGTGCVLFARLPKCSDNAGLEHVSDCVPKYTDGFRGEADGKMRRNKLGRNRFPPQLGADCA